MNTSVCTYHNHVYPLWWNSKWSLHNVSLLSWISWVLNDHKSYLRMIANRHIRVVTALRIQAAVFGVWIPTKKNLSALNFWDRFWGPPSLLCNGYRGLFRSKAARTEVNNSLLSSADVKNEWSHTYTPPPPKFPHILGSLKLYLLTLLVVTTRLLRPYPIHRFK